LQPSAYFRESFLLDGNYKWSKIIPVYARLKTFFSFLSEKQSRVNKIHLIFSKHLREKEQVLLFITNMAQEMDYEMSLFYLIYSFKMMLYSLIRILKLDIHISTYQNTSYQHTYWSYLNTNVGIKLYLQNLYIYKLWRECFPNAYLFLIDYACVKKKKKKYASHHYVKRCWMHARMHFQRSIMNGLSSPCTHIQRQWHRRTHIHFAYTGRSFLVLIFKIF